MLDAFFHPISVTRFEGSAVNVGQRLDFAGGDAVRRKARGQFQFVPGETGGALFGRRISDGHGGIDHATAFFFVNGPPRPV